MSCFYRHRWLYSEDISMENFSGLLRDGRYWGTTGKEQLLAVVAVGSRVSVVGKVKESTCFRRGSSWNDSHWSRSQCLGNWVSAKENLQPPASNKRSTIVQRLPKKAAGTKKLSSRQCAIRKHQARLPACLICWLSLDPR